MAEKADQMFDSGEFGRAVIRVLLNDVWYEISPRTEPSNGQTAAEDVVNLPIAGPIHVISAYNPGFREQDDVNEDRHGQLESRLEALGMEFMPAVGFSPDAVWVEPSWAVIGVDRSAACGIGHDFGQVAVFELETTVAGSCRVRVLRCSDGRVESDATYSVIRHSSGS